MHHGHSPPWEGQILMATPLSEPKSLRNFNNNFCCSISEASISRLARMAEGGLGNAAATTTRLRSASASLLNNIGERGAMSEVVTEFAQVGDGHLQCQRVDLKDTNALTAGALSP